MINIMAKLSYGVTFRIIISSHRGKARNNTANKDIGLFQCMKTGIKKVVLTGICLVH